MNDYLPKHTIAIVLGTVLAIVVVYLLPDDFSIVGMVRDFVIVFSCISVFLLVSITISFLRGEEL